MISDKSRALTKSAWAQIEAHIGGASNKNAICYDPQFVKYAWHFFKPKVALDILMSDKGMYRGQKEVLFAGFCAWVLFPDTKRKVYRHCMSSEILWIISESEKMGRDIIRDDGLLGDLVGRLIHVDRGFFEDIYYPIGGLYGIAESLRKSQFAKELKDRVSQAQTVVAISKIHHFHALNLANKNLYNQASHRKGASLVQKVYGRTPKEVFVGEDNADLRWQLLEKAAGLIYAASTIELDRNYTILDMIASDDVSYKHCENLLPLWIGRARYAAEVIFSKLIKPEACDLAMEYLPKLPIQEFPGPDFDEGARKAIVAGYDKKTILTDRTRRKLGAR